jgi:hypothetical protein
MTQDMHANTSRAQVHMHSNRGNVHVIAAERQTTKFGTARFQSNVIPLLVKARSDTLLLQCVGFGGWSTRDVRMTCTLVAHSASVHSSIVDECTRVSMHAGTCICIYPHDFQQSLLRNTN